MPATKRVQVLMEPAEYRRLEEIARLRHVSVGQLVRLALRREVLGAGRTGGGIVDAIAACALPVDGIEGLTRVDPRGANEGRI